MPEYAVFAEEEKDLGPCDCCGTMTHRVWGWVNHGPDTVAAYFVTWTKGDPKGHGAAFDFVIGRWGDGTTAADRVAVALDLRFSERGPEFMVVDAEPRGMAREGVAESALNRSQVIGTKVADAVFGMVDAVWVEDARIKELTA